MQKRFSPLHERCYPDVSKNWPGAAFPFRKIVLFQKTRLTIVLFQAAKQRNGRKPSLAQALSFNTGSMLSGVPNISICSSVLQKSSD
jgi:hypothetical protein